MTKLYSVKELIEDYVWYRANIFSAKRKNSKELKIKAETDLDKATNEHLTEDQYTTLKERLDDIVTNSMHAMSGLSLWGEDIIRFWEPKRTYHLKFKAEDLEDRTILYIEDDGCGIDWWNRPIMAYATLSGLDKVAGDDVRERGPTVG